MPRLVNRNPSYSRHRASGQAVVTIGGKTIYLGLYNSKASRSEYDRVIGEWLAGGRHLRPRQGITVAELILRYWEHVKGYYRLPDGTPSREQENIKHALRPLKQLYGSTPACEFGPLSLKAIQGRLVEGGAARTYVNAETGKIKQLFKWAVAEELVPASVHHGLSALSGLKRGRSGARETGPVLPVPDNVLEATLPHLSSTIRAMVQLQLVTGARPDEICGLTGDAIDQSDSKLWKYTLAHHKTSHHGPGHDRTLYFGEHGQAILRPFLLKCGGGYVFSPIRAEAERRALLSENRTTPLSCGNRQGTNRTRKPRKTPGERYDTDSYRRAIARACEKAFKMPDELVEPRTPAQKEGDTPEAKAERLKARGVWMEAHTWHPHQLRHNAATQLRAAFGLEGAQVILGHSRITTTQIYAEKNVAAATKIMREVG